MNRLLHHSFGDECPKCEHARYIRCLVTGPAISPPAWWPTEPPTAVEELALYLVSFTPRGEA